MLQMNAVEDSNKTTANDFCPGGEEGAERKKGYSGGEVASPSETENSSSPTLARRGLGGGSSWGGARSGAGRKPKVQIVQDDPCLKEVEKFISDNLMDIVAAMVERAKKGDNVAAKYLIDRKLGRPAKLTIEDFIECQEYLEEAIDEITEEISEAESIDDLDTASSDLSCTETGIVQAQNTKQAQAEFLRRMRANNRRRKLARRK